MTLWAYPGVVTAPVQGSTFAAELDLGCRWYHPISIRIAGIRPRRNSTLALDLVDAMPVGTRFTAIAGHIGVAELVTAHIVVNGTDLVSTLRGTTADLPPAVYGNTGTAWRYPATVLDVTDGDSVTCRLNLGVRTEYRNAVRVEHVDAYEDHTARGQLASQFGQAELTPGLVVTVTSRKLEKYGRILGAITLPDGRDYAAGLLAAGHAVPYEGGAR